MIEEQELHDYNQWLMEVWNPNQLRIPFAQDAPSAYLRYKSELSNDSITNPAPEPVYENQCTFKGNMAKTDFYIILDYIDQMKQRGWFLLKNNRTEKDDRVTFDYQLAKNTPNA